MMNSLRRMWQYLVDRPNALAGILGLLRLVLFVVFPIIYLGVLGNALFDRFDAGQFAVQVRQTNPFFRGYPTWVFFLFNPHTLKYMLAPVIGIVCVLIAAASYVQDIYAIRRFRDALRFIFSATFRLFLPTLVIDDGEKKFAKGTTNLLDIIGGPGTVLVQPGNAITTRFLRRRGNSFGEGAVNMAPFETIGEIATLDEKVDQLDEIRCTTRDGIQVIIRDVNYRFRIQYENEAGVLRRRNVNDPYPASLVAVTDMAYNRMVVNDEWLTWNSAVQRQVRNGITDHISTRNIDDLTSPRGSERDPRSELRNELMVGTPRTRLQELGTELLWIDVGHIDIVDPGVDSGRLDLWATDWIGNASNIRADGEAVRQAYQELGRAEAQSEYIMSITNELKNIDMSGDPRENLRRILLVRTAQILDAMADDRKKEKKPEDSKP
jgi:hypothetical protein